MMEMNVTTNVPAGEVIEIPPELWIHIMGGAAAVMKKVEEILKSE